MNYFANAQMYQFNGKCFVVGGIEKIVNNSCPLWARDIIVFAIDTLVPTLMGVFDAMSSDGNNKRTTYVLPICLVLP